MAFSLIPPYLIDSNNERPESWLSQTFISREVCIVCSIPTVLMDLYPQHVDLGMVVPTEQLQHFDLGRFLGKHYYMLPVKCILQALQLEPTSDNTVDRTLGKNQADCWQPHLPEDEAQPATVTTSLKHQKVLQAAIELSRDELGPTEVLVYTYTSQAKAT